MTDDVLVSVVDDDESVRKSIPIFCAPSVQCRAFTSAEDFLASDVVDATRCVILDVAMPGMSGPDLFEELKRRPQTIPVIFITAHGNTDLCAQLIKDGAIACLHKPFDPPTLVEALQGPYPSLENTPMIACAHPNAATYPSRSPMPRPEPTVFIVDDDISVRESLLALVTFAGWPVAVFDSAQAFLDHPRAPGPGCLVLDVSLPDLNGLELQERLGQNETELPIIFITGHGDVPTTVRAMKAGAIEFLTKPIDDQILLSAIADAILRSDAAHTAHVNLDRLRTDYASLSKREREVMALIATGLLNKQVGGDLGISEITVKAHRGQVMRKMKAHSFAELVNMASRLGLAGPQHH